MSGNQKGFTAVEAVIIVVIVVVLGLGAWFVWDKNRSDVGKKDEAKTAAIQDVAANQQQADDQPVAQKYLVIKEWGVSFKTAAVNDDAYYVVQADKPDYAYVSVKSLTDPECAPDKTSVGVFTRFKQGDRDPISDRLYTEAVPDATKVGDYYYFFSHAQAYCVENQEAKLKAVAQAFSDNVKTAEALY